MHSLLELPGLVLAEPNSSSGRVRKIVGRLARLNDGLEVYNSAPQAAAAGGAQRMPEAQRHAQRVHRNLAQGSITRAAGALDAAPVAQYDADLPAKLQALLPQADPPAIPEALQDPAVRAAASALVSEEVLARVLPKLPRGSAGGPSGWTYEHVQVVIRSGPDGSDAVRRLLGAIAGGLLPQLPELTDSRLIALLKPDGGVRPIAIGEVFYRLAGLCALAASPGLGPSLAPLQLGVSTRGGAQTIGHAAQAALEADDELVLFLLDIKNAFGTVSRTSVLAKVAELAPHLLPFVTWAYKQPSRLWVNGAPPGAPPLWSMAGVRQGDPLGPLLFALVLQAVLVKLRDEHAGAPALAYLDDCTIVARVDAGVAACRTFIAECAPHNLFTAPPKCLTYSRTPALAEQAAQALQFTHCPDGVVVVGTPLGSDEYVRAHASSKAEKAVDLIGIMLDLPLQSQDQMLLLRMSLSRRLVHLTRTVTWDLVGDALSTLDAAVEIAACTIGGVDHNNLGIVATWQLHAPLRHGGFGLRDTDAFEAGAAFLAGAAVAQNTLCDSPEVLQPFKGPRGAQLSEQWGALVDESTGKWCENMREASVGCIALCMPQAQRQVAREQADLAQSQVMALLGEGDSLQHEVALARLRSVACRASGAWLDALPVAPTLRLSDRHFRSAMQLRLGLLQMRSDAVGRTCGCNRVLQATDAEHALLCKLHSGACTMRHDILVGFWCRAAHRAGIASAKEPVYRELQRQAASAGQRSRRANSDGGERGDALLVMPEGVLVADLAVVHPTAESYRAGAARADGSAAAVSGARKVAAFEALGGDGGYEFTPLIVEAYGRLGKPALGLLSRLADIASEGGKVTKAGFIASALKEMSVGLCRGNGMMLAAGRKVLVGVTGRDVQNGAVEATDELL